MTTKELPPARYPTAEDKINLFREFGIEAHPVPHWYYENTHDLAIRIEGGEDVLKKALAVAAEHELTVSHWTWVQGYRDYLSGIGPNLWKLEFNFWEGTNRPRYGGDLSDLLSK